jgi:hypothetical protein
MVLLRKCGYRIDGNIVVTFLVYFVTRPLVAGMPVRMVRMQPRSCTRAFLLLAGHTLARCRQEFPSLRPLLPPFGYINLGHASFVCFNFTSFCYSHASLSSCQFSPARRIAYYSPLPRGCRSVRIVS